MQNDKSKAFRAIMSDGKLRQMVKDAYREPVGSLNRKRALDTMRIISSRSRSSGTQDGKGGPSAADVMLNRGEEGAPAAQNSQTNPSSLSFDAASTALITPASSQPTITAPQSGLKSQSSGVDGFDFFKEVSDDYGNFIDSATILGESGKFYDSKDTDAPFVKAGKGLANLATSAGAAMSKVGANLWYAPVAVPTLLKNFYQWGVTPPGTPKPTSTVNVPSAPGASSGTEAGTADPATGTATGEGTEGSDNSIVSDIRFTMAEKQSLIQAAMDEYLDAGVMRTPEEISKYARFLMQNSLLAGAIPNTRDPMVNRQLELDRSLGGAEYLTKDTIDAWVEGQGGYESLLPEQKLFVDSLKNGTGSSGFRSSLLGNVDALASVTGIPAEVLRKFPMYAAVTPDLKGIRETIERQFHVDSIYDQVLNLESRHRLSSDAFKTYVVSKDLYLKDLQEKKDGLRNYTVGRDMSDPWLREQYSAYGGWLDANYNSKVADYNVFLRDAAKYETEDYNRALSFLNLRLNQANSHIADAQETAKIESEANQKFADSVWTKAEDALEGVYEVYRSGSTAMDGSRASHLEELASLDKMIADRSAPYTGTKADTVKYDPSTDYTDFYTEDKDKNRIPKISTYGEFVNQLNAKGFTDEYSQKAYEDAWINSNLTSIKDKFAASPYVGKAMLDEMLTGLDFFTLEEMTEVDPVTGEISMANLSDDQKNAFSKGAEIVTKAGNYLASAGAQYFDTVAESKKKKIDEAFSGKGFMNYDSYEKWAKKFDLEQGDFGEDTAVAKVIEEIYREEKEIFDRRVQEVGLEQAVIDQDVKPRYDGIKKIFTMRYLASS
jgi:hypothetical protein